MNLIATLFKSLFSTFCDNKVRTEATVSSRAEGRDWSNSLQDIYDATNEVKKASYGLVESYKDLRIQTKKVDAVLNKEGEDLTAAFVENADEIKASVSIKGAVVKKVRLIVFQLKKASIAIASLLQKTCMLLEAVGRPVPPMVSAIRTASVLSASALATAEVYVL